LIFISDISQSNENERGLSIEKAADWQPFFMIFPESPDVSYED